MAGERDRRHRRPRCRRSRWSITWASRAPSLMPHTPAAVPRCAIQAAHGGFPVVLEGRQTAGGGDQTWSPPPVTFSPGFTPFGQAGNWETDGKRTMQIAARCCAKTRRTARTCMLPCRSEGVHPSDLQRLRPARCSNETVPDPHRQTPLGERFPGDIPCHRRNLHLRTRPHRHNATPISAARRPVHALETACTTHSRTGMPRDRRSRQLHSIGQQGHRDLLQPPPPAQAQGLRLPDPSRDQAAAPTRPRGITNTCPTSRGNFTAGSSGRPCIALLMARQRFVGAEERSELPRKAARVSSAAVLSHRDARRFITAHVGRQGLCCRLLPPLNGRRAA